jgi:adhesin transport system membrane fusion protein
MNHHLESSSSTNSIQRNRQLWLKKLSGIEQDDLKNLMGRHRLTQALELEDKSSSHHLTRSLYYLSGAVLLFLPIAAFTPITQVIETSGEVVPKGSVNVIQHLEGGIVSSVKVDNGQQVSKGDVLIELSPQLVGSAYDAANQELENLVLQQIQLRSAIKGEKILNSSSNSKDKVVQSQQKLLTSRLANKSDQIAAAKASVAEKKAEVAGLSKQITFQRQEVNMWDSLTDSGAASKLQMVTAQGKLAEMIGAQNEARKALKQAEANLRGLESGIIFENNSKIAELVGEEAVISNNIKKIEDQLKRTKIISPVDGVVSDLRYKAPGSVVGPGAVVLQVVPTQRSKIVELQIPSKDIGFVNIGQSVDIKLLPFDSSIYGTINGKITSIAGTTVQDEDTGKYFYQARVSLDHQYLDANNKKIPIQAGMPLIGDIKGQQRSVLRYLLQPFTRTIGSAFRETN